MASKMHQFPTPLRSWISPDSCDASCHVWISAVQLLGSHLVCWISWHVSWLNQRWFLSNYFDSSFTGREPSFWMLQSQLLLKPPLYPVSCLLLSCWLCLQPFWLPVIQWQSSSFAHWGSLVSWWQWNHDYHVCWEDISSHQMLWHGDLTYATNINQLDMGKSVARSGCVMFYIVLLETKDI